MEVKKLISYSVVINEDEKRIFLNIFRHYKSDNHSFEISYLKNKIKYFNPVLFTANEMKFLISKILTCDIKLVKKTDLLIFSSICFALTAGCNN